MSQLDTLKCCLLRLLAHTGSGWVNSLLIPVYEGSLSDANDLIDDVHGNQQLSLIVHDVRGGYCKIYNRQLRHIHYK